MEKNLTGQSKWGQKDKFTFRPKWARWKLHLQISKDRFREYYSYDYRYVYVNNEKLKLYQEQLALIEMIERIREKNPGGYKFGNVFGNFTDDLSTDKKNYNYHVFSMTPDLCTWKQDILYYKNTLSGSAYLNVRVNTRETIAGWKEKEEKVADAIDLGAKNQDQQKRIIRILEHYKTTAEMTQDQARAEIDKILQYR
jgi:hypothetical protein